MQFVGFFRGINVGGKHIVKMADLRQLFLDCGFDNVLTYIQSGNVLFWSRQDSQSLVDLISRAFTERFHFQSDVVIRSGDEISAIIAALPFSTEDIAQAGAANPAVEHVYVYVSNHAIDPAAAKDLQLSYGGQDLLIAGERALYLLCYQSIRDSKLAVSLAKLDVSLTARNWKTMLKIQDLLHTQ